MMKSSFIVVAFVVILTISVSAFKSAGAAMKSRTGSVEMSVSMRDVQNNLKKSIASLAIVPLLLAFTATPAHAADDIQSYYWGVGCFWHAQHEFIGAEKRLLGRTDEQLTVRSLLIRILRSIFIKNSPNGTTKYT